MKLTILGNNGPYPAPGGACSGYLLSSASGRTHVLLDCGTGVLSNLSRHLPWEEMSAVILSHLHYDHMSDLLPMLYALQFHPRTAPLPVYAPDAPAQVRDLLKAPAYALHPMEDCEIGEIHFSFCPVRHPIPSFALRATCDGRSFVYTGDTNEVQALDSFAQGADLLLADAGLSAADWHMEAPHLSAERCARLAERTDCGRLLLTHLNPRYTAEALEREARTVRPDAQFVRIGAEYEI